ncbi:hypothetical protein [Synechocystis sp. PCC 7338]|uniref:hypothetical protein n=1 Tax=Synechocystis sp. PCC 7338 TaxID=2732530 RepID=UPI0020114FF2|nr:hypothetical protein [Synechocystis sp. PCC 7338]
MAETVYLETNIFGYLTARSSQNLILVANVEVAREWWQLQKNNFQLYVSQVVLDEVSRGESNYRFPTCAIGAKYFCLVRYEELY